MKQWNRLLGLTLTILVIVGITSVLHTPTNTLPTVAKVAAAPVKPSAPAPTTPTRDELLKLTNDERARNGQLPLVEDSRLDASAQAKADDETTNNYFGHISPTTGMHGYGYIPQYWPECIQNGESITENIHQNTAQAAVTAWINSPPHHAAMISPSDLAVGFGISGIQIVAHYCTSVE